MNVYYNDIEPYCAAVLRRNIEAGRLYPGFIDGRNIRRIRDTDIARLGRRYRQFHLFAGIGGFALGFKWAGVPADASILTGGPPCQPFSVAGKRQGTRDARHLWPEMRRFIRVLGPEFVVFENVAGFASWGGGSVLDSVVTDLEALQYETLPPLMVPAAAFGAWHRRDRVWIVAHTAKPRSWGLPIQQGESRQADRHADWRSQDAANCARQQLGIARQPRQHASMENAADTVAGLRNSGFDRLGRQERTDSTGSSERSDVGNAADTSSAGLPRRCGKEDEYRAVRNKGNAAASLCSDDASDALCKLFNRNGRIWRWWTEFTDGGWWDAEPAVGRVAYGVPDRVDRLKGLGNAIVPVHAVWIGKAIRELMNLEQENTR